MATNPFLPLDGTVVLDLSRYLPGPFLTRTLADLGADVIQVEAPTGDPVRHIPPLLGDSSASFAGLNFGKRSVAIDLRKREGVELLLALAGGADVVVESFRPGVLERLGVGYAQLRATNPAIVLCSISGYGQDGPLRDVPGHDINYLARAGLLGLCGPKGAAPPAPAFQAADIGGGALSGAVGILAALLERAQTGVGRHLDISMTRSVFAFLAVEIPRRAAGVVEGRGEGLLTGGMPCYRIYTTADGRHMALGALEPKFFAAFCERAGVVHLALEGFASGEKGAEVIAELDRLFASRSQQQWIELLAGCDCCCEPVRTPEEAIADPDVDLPTAQLDGALAVRSHVGVSAAPADPVAPPPRLGEHSDEVVAQLGVDPGIVERARAAGALIGH